MKHIKTWNERCEEHPDHNGIVTHEMIQARMQEEIDELRSERDWYEAKIQTYKNFAAIAEASMHRITDVQQEMDCYGDGNVYRGQRSADSQLQTILVAPRREWVGLTDDEKAKLDDEYGDDILAHLDAIEAKLKEKNGG